MADLEYIVMDLAHDMLPRSSPGSPGHCVPGNDYNGDLSLRISSVFVILIGSMLGAWFPVFAKRHQSVGMPEWAFFIAKYFGSGVIIATAFIHLLAPANEALTNPCLTGVITEYPWVEGIALITIFSLFFIELMTMRYADFGGGHSHDGDEHDTEALSTSDFEDSSDPKPAVDLTSSHKHQRKVTNAPGNDHLGHSREHTDNEDVSSDWQQRGIIPETYAAQMTAIFILEFGVIFHSIFIGLTLAVASVSEFTTLYIVLVFHQTFEGLGLGSRLASVPWPKKKKWTPYILACGYGVSTPIAIGIGLGVRNTYPPGSSTTLITNGVFDSISAGILIYTGLVELMAHEFMFSTQMQKAKIQVILSAFGLMCLGAALMALLGKWA